LVFNDGIVRLFDSLTLQAIDSIQSSSVIKSFVCWFFKNNYIQKLLITKKKKVFATNVAFSPHGTCIIVGGHRRRRNSNNTAINTNVVQLFDLAHIVKQRFQNNNIGLVNFYKHIFDKSLLKSSFFFCIVSLHCEFI
jgi:hypothetical protein